MAMWNSLNEGYAHRERHKTPRDMMAASRIFSPRTSRKEPKLADTLILAP